MTVGTGGIAPPPPQYFANPKKFELENNKIYKCNSYKAKKGS